MKSNNFSENFSIDDEIYANVKKQEELFLQNINSSSSFIYLRISIETFLNSWVERLDNNKFLNFKKPKTVFEKISYIFKHADIYNNEAMDVLHNSLQDIDDLYRVLSSVSHDNHLLHVVEGDQIETNVDIYFKLFTAFAQIQSILLKRNIKVNFIKPQLGQVLSIPELLNLFQTKIETLTEEIKHLNLENGAFLSRLEILSKNDSKVYDENYIAQLNRKIEDIDKLSSEIEFTWRRNVIKPINEKVFLTITHGENKFRKVSEAKEYLSGIVDAIDVDILNKWKQNQSNIDEMASLIKGEIEVRYSNYYNIPLDFSGFVSRDSKMRYFEDKNIQLFFIELNAQKWTELKSVNFSFKSFKYLSEKIEWFIFLGYVFGFAEIGVVFFEKSTNQYKVKYYIVRDYYIKNVNYEKILKNEIRRFENAQSKL